MPHFIQALIAAAVLTPLTIAFNAAASTSSAPAWHTSVQPEADAASVAAASATMTTATAVPATMAAFLADEMFLDEDAALAETGFALSADDMILKAKEFLYNGQGVKKPELLSEEFTFMGPVVGGAGGLPKDEYLEAVGGFDIKVAFPDLNPRFHHFRIDPLEGDRVWFTSVASGTHDGPFLGIAPTHKSFRTPPQACSIKLSADGKVIKYTIGHVMERSVGNTGGLGGIFGPLVAIGKPLPFPEARPWKASKRYRFIQFLGRLASAAKKRKEAKAAKTAAVAL